MRFTDPAGDGRRTPGLRRAARMLSRLGIVALPLLVIGCKGEKVAPAAAPMAMAAPPTVSIAFNPAEIVTGGTSTLTWSATNATACTASGAWSGNQALSGSLAVTGGSAGSTTYTLSCTGSGGTASSAATLVVKAPVVKADKTTPFVPFGVYVGNPNGNDKSAMAWFQGQWDASAKQLVRTPRFFGTFTDFSQDWSQWPSNAGWTAWSFSQSGRVAGMKPVIGIKLSTNAYWNRQGDAFREIIAGQRDQVYRDVVTAWRDAGYTELRFRISYEFNGNFMPDNFGNTAEMLDLWKRAFMRVADVMHAVPNVKVLIVWNPVDINWSGNSVSAAYPGDNYVDVISSDIYSTLYPLSLYDWTTTRDAASLAEWIKNPVNRTHFWDHPGGTFYTTDGSGWGLVQALDFAIAHRKPFGISETGVGGDNVKTGLSDDPQFPQYLRTRLADFIARGGTVDHVIIWDFDASDGSWRFSGVPAKAATAAAWAAFLDPNSTQ